MPDITEPISFFWLSSPLNNKRLGVIMELFGQCKMSLCVPLGSGVLPSSSLVDIFFILPGMSFGTPERAVLLVKTFLAYFMLMLRLPIKK